MSRISEIFNAESENLDRFLQKYSDPEFMLLSKRLITCILASQRNLLDEKDSTEFRKIIDISNFKKMISGENFQLERDRKIKLAFENYKLTYSNLILQRIKLNVFFTNENAGNEDIRLFIQNNPNFEKETTETMNGVQIECDKELDELKLLDIPLFEELIQIYHDSKNLEYKNKSIEFYKSEYYNNKSFNFFMASVGEIYMNDYSQYGKNKRNIFMGR